MLEVFWWHFYCPDKAIIILMSDLGKYRSCIYQICIWHEAKRESGSQNLIRLKKWTNANRVQLSADKQVGVYVFHSDPQCTPTPESR